MRLLAVDDRLRALVSLDAQSVGWAGCFGGVAGRLLGARRE